MLNQYWAHCKNYPRCITLNDELFDELSGILMHLILGASLLLLEWSDVFVILIDVNTAGESTNPFDRDDIRQWLDMMDGMKSMYQLI